MKNCPVCFSEIDKHAVKCPQCLSFIKPQVNEGQFWGTYLMVGGILIGALGYIWYLAEADNFRMQLMNVGMFLAYLGFLVYGFGTFLSWFRSPKEKVVVEEKDVEEKLSPDKKRCFYCREIIDIRAIKCNYCYSFLRKEKGKVVATFIIVSGILILTTAYVLFLAQNLQSEIYIKIGLVIILTGILAFLLTVIKQRYTTPYH
ncbi:MAG TPA: hypothetical protein VM123_20430 [archaeon]|nr:hypothetical protein [archaeon]